MPCERCNGVWECGPDRTQLCQGPTIRMLSLTSAEQKEASTVQTDPPQWNLLGYVSVGDGYVIVSSRKEKGDCIVNLKPAGTKPAGDECEDCKDDKGWVWYSCGGGECDDSPPWKYEGTAEMFSTELDIYTRPGTGGGCDVKVVPVV